MGGFKDKVISLFKKNTPKQKMYGRGKKVKKSEEEDYNKPKRESIFYNGNYIEYKSNGDRNKSLPLKEYLCKIKPYLRDIIIDLQESDTCKMQ